jgi:hypothetical protein
LIGIKSSTDPPATDPPARREPVEDGIAEGRIANDLTPVIDRYLRGHERGADAVTIVEQIAPLLGGELGQPPVVEYANRVSA